MEKEKETELAHAEVHPASGLSEVVSDSQEFPLIDGVEWAVAEKRYLRKLDRIMMPAMIALYFFESMDRANIGNAKLYGVDRGHDTPFQGVGTGTTSLSSKEWQLVVMIVWTGLILGQAPGCIAYLMLPPSKWIAFTVCGWAAASILQTTTHNLSGIIVCRIFIGAFDGLFGIGMCFYLSFWYKRSEMGIRVSSFFGASVISGGFGGLIAYGVGHINSSLPAWKMLFLIEALPAFCFGLFCLYWIPDRPLRNSRFSGIDQKVAEARYDSQMFDSIRKVTREELISVVKDWRLYVQMLLHTSIAALLSSIAGFLPTIVRDLGYLEPAYANLMTVPPYACAAVFMVCNSLHSDHHSERGFHIAWPASMTFICYLLLAVLPESAVKGKYACVCFGVAGVFCVFPLATTWAINNMGGEARRAIALAFYTTIAAGPGSIAGSWFYPAEDAPQFRKGHLVCAMLALFIAVVALSNKAALTVINRRRDQLYGKSERGTEVDAPMVGKWGPNYRFIT